MDQAKARHQLATKILSHIKGEILISLRFLDFALSYLSENEEHNDYIDFGTNGKVLLFSDHYVINQYYAYPKQLNRMYLHTLLHAMFRHPISLKFRNKKLWDLCCDISVENIIDDLNRSMFTNDQQRQREKVYRELESEIKAKFNAAVLSSEYIYPILLNKKEKTILELTQLFYRDDHTLWARNPPSTGKSADGEEDNGDHAKNHGQGESVASDGESHISSDLLREMNEIWTDIMGRMITDLQTYSKAIGSEHAELLVKLQIATRRRYNYKDFLRKYMVYREVMKESLDEFDLIYYTYGLSNYSNMPLIDSNEYRDQQVLEEFVIAIDTSGSVFFSEVQRFLEAMYSIIQQNITHRRVNLHVIQADNSIHSHHVIHDKKDFALFIENFILRGGGGTSFIPVFNTIDQLILSGQLRNLKGMFYFTDGFGDFPVNPPPYDSVFVFFSEFYNIYNVPFWAKKLVLTKEDFIDEENA